VLNPLASDFLRLEGCRVAFEAVHVTQERQCTQMLCGAELPCCNACEPGGLAFLRERDPVLLSREGEPLSCRAGRNCTSQQDCAVPLKKSLSGEPPSTCDFAVLACLAQPKQRAH
jgi:hypothetical protein